MNQLYSRIISFCEALRITPYKLCKDVQISQSTLTDLKVGRKESLSIKNLGKIADFFQVPVTALTGNEDEFDKYLKLIESNRHIIVVDTNQLSMRERWKDTKNRLEKYDQELKVTAEEMSDLAETFNTLRDRPEMKTLFKSAKNATPEQILAVTALLDSFKKTAE